MPTFWAPTWQQSPAKHDATRTRGESLQDLAGVAQPVEHLFCKQAVRGSSPLASSNAGPARLTEREFRTKDESVTNNQGIRFKFGGLPERPKGAGCKPAGIAYVGSNPTPSTRFPGSRRFIPSTT